MKNRLNAAAALILLPFASAQAQQRPDQPEWGVAKVNATSDAYACKEGKLDGFHVIVEPHSLLLPDGPFVTADARRENGKLHTTVDMSPYRNVGTSEGNRIAFSINDAISGFIKNGNTYCAVHPNHVPTPPAQKAGKAAEANPAPPK